MDSESISAYIRNEEIERCLFGINGCPIPVLVETLDGEEFSIIKAYRITGRTACIKILINGNGTTNSLLNEIESLKDSIENYESEIQDLKDSKSKD